MLRISDDQSLLLNDSDPDGDRLITIGGYPWGSVSFWKATVELKANGTFVYDPRQSTLLKSVPEGGQYLDYFHYQAYDGQLGSQATVYITVLGENDPPSALDDRVSIGKLAIRADITSSALQNDFDVDYPANEQPFITGIETNGTLGSVSLQNGRLFYEPGVSFQHLQVGETATDQLTYTISDPHGATSSATIFIEVVGEAEIGDLNSDGVLDALDINAMCMAVHTVNASTRFDLDQSGTVDDVDHGIYLRTYLHVGFGDTNLDGIFDSTDLILAFQGGQYEDVLAINSMWETGDWNCDREFDSSDLVRAFQTNIYVQ